MPRELIATAAGTAAYRDLERPELAAGQVRVRSTYGAAKHGTEMALFKGYAGPRGGYDGQLQVFDAARSLFGYPLPLGNMAVGQVIEVSEGAEGLAVGDTVFGHGPFREEHVWPAARARRLPAGVPWQAAVCLDPADFALGALRDGHVRLGDAVAVFGMGAIGLMAMQLARLAGAHPVIAVEPLAPRREVAAECGADLVLDPGAVDAGRQIKVATGGRGADVCIEYSGDCQALQAALRGVAYGGTVVAGAWPAAYPAGLDLGAEAHFNRPTVVFTRACSEPGPDYPRWNEGRLLDTAWRLLASGALRAVPVVRPIVDFADLLEEYPKIGSHPEQSVKLGVRFPGGPS
ncbi:MAG: zinc-binding alcohol dehydrogenase [Gemmatimonadota bacterium]